MGLQTAPTVVRRDSRYVLVAGRHRIEALRSLGFEHVPVRLVEMNHLEARMWAISENLHRAELTVQERSRQIAEYADLAKRKGKLEPHCQLHPIRTDQRGFGASCSDAGARRAATGTPLATSASRERN